MRDRLIFLCIILSLTRVSPEKTSLYVGALLELSNHWYQNYVNFFINIIEYVFEEVENRTDILADYSLKLVTKDTQVNILLILSESRTLWYFIIRKYEFTESNRGALCYLLISFCRKMQVMHSLLRQKVRQSPLFNNTLIFYNSKTLPPFVSCIVDKLDMNVNVRFKI